MPKTRKRRAPRLSERLAFVFRIYGGGDFGPAALWLRDVYGRGFLQGADLVEMTPGPDQSHKADQVLKALEESEWIERVSYAPSHSQKAWLSLERKSANGKPPYTYPREHGFGPTNHPEAIRFIRRIYEREKDHDSAK